MTKFEKDCLFCKLIKKEIPSCKVFESLYTYAFLDISPNSEGHTLIIPKEHYQDFCSTPDIYVKEIARVKKIICNLIQKSLKPIGFNFISNQGKDAAQAVFHYHEHIIPKFKKEEGYFHKIVKDVSKFRDLETIAELIRIEDKD